MRRVPAAEIGFAVDRFDAHFAHQPSNPLPSHGMPAEYFLLTFTVPFEFRALAFAHQRVVFDLMLRCTWATVRTFSQNDRQLQGAPGGIAVLHHCCPVKK